MSTVHGANRFIGLHTIRDLLRGEFARFRNYFGWSGMRNKDLTALLAAELSVAVFLASLFYIALINANRYQLTSMVRHDFGIKTSPFSFALPFVPLFLILVCATILGTLLRSYVTERHIAEIKDFLDAKKKLIQRLLWRKSFEYDPQMREL